MTKVFEMITLDQNWVLKVRKVTCMIPLTGKNERNGAGGMSVLQEGRERGRRESGDIGVRKFALVNVGYCMTETNHQQPYNCGKKNPSVLFTNNWCLKITTCLNKVIFKNLKKRKRISLLKNTFFKYKLEF